MRETKIKTCFCFLDLALAFISNQSLLAISKYENGYYAIRKRKEIFVLNHRERFEFDQSCNLTVHVTIVSCCVKCFKFQTFLKVTLQGDWIMYAVET